MCGLKGKQTWRQEVASASTLTQAWGQYVTQVGLKQNGGAAQPALGAKQDRALHSPRPQENVPP